MFDDPSKLTPAIVLAVASFVAVAALPVVDPDVPETLPVTSPTNEVAVIIPDVLIDTVVPIPTDFGVPTASVNSISPLEIS